MLTNIISYTVHYKPISKLTNELQIKSVVMKNNTTHRNVNKNNCKLRGSSDRQTDK